MFQHIGRMAAAAGNEQLASGSLWSFQTFHSCSWRTLPASIT
jgi:hypothetical protein